MLRLAQLGGLEAVEPFKPGDSQHLTYPVLPGVVPPRGHEEVLACAGTSQVVVVLRPDRIDGLPEVGWLRRPECVEVHHAQSAISR